VLVMAISGISIVTMPIGIVIGPALCIIGAPFYFVGYAISGDEMEKYPPEL
jgi:hypothetical protein